MEYGYFDDINREYVITRPDTPAPWANYLGSPEYGAIISNNAGGYSFVKSGANGRLIRYRFNSVPADQPGRYVYLRDCESGDYWSGSWQPVGKPLDRYRCECRHGLSYTVISSWYSGIRTETLYYVPLGKAYEVWRVQVTNEGKTRRNLSATGYVEFTTDGNYEQDSVNLQYSQFITKTYFETNRIRLTENENCKKTNGPLGAERFFGVAGAPVSSYCGDREEFVGPYRGYANPVGVERGDCGNLLNYNGNPCGALQLRFDLEPGETREFCFILGVLSDTEASRILTRYEAPAVAQKEWGRLRAFWEEKLGRLQVHTPDPNFDHMVNIWNAYQCFITYTWSRAASFVYCGLRNGLGFRDTVQDSQGILHLAPEIAIERIRLMLSGQVDSGAGMPLVPFGHVPGKVKLPGDPDYHYDPYRSDDALWLFPTIDQYIGETGNTAFLDEVIPFANKGAGSVYEHLKRAIRFSEEHSGAHGLPAGLYADWNDCLRMGENGESTFVAFQLYLAIRLMWRWAMQRDERDYADILSRSAAELKKTLRNICWEGDQYIRGIRDSGEKVGSKDDPEASLWLNPQSWAVISGCADPEQADLLLEKVHRRLNTKFGLSLMDPPYREHAFDGARMLLYNPSTKENGGVFSQTQGWIILAEALMGHGNRAYEYFRECNPAAMNARSELRRIEPYVHGQSIEASCSPHEGRAHVHWLTGTATTVMVACVEGILGLHPVLEGLTLSPAIPSEWKEFSIEKIFRRKKLHILVVNPNGSQGGTPEVTLNGVRLHSNLVPAVLLKDENEIIVRMIR